MKIQRVKFMATDNAELNGILYLPDVNTNRVIISIHGMSSNCFKAREDIISEVATNNNIAYLCFNNRGYELVTYVKKIKGEEEIKEYSGTTYEDVLDSYYDICGAINKALELGFSEIYLQGHSLGCTKIVYTYNRLLKENNNLLKCVKSIILLSLIDIVDTQKFDLKGEYDKMLEIAEQMEKEGKKNELMPKEAFIHPMSVKTYLRYFKYNEDINFAQYSNLEYDYEDLNNIKIPLFLRWGNVHEMVIQPLDELVSMLKKKIKNNKLDINYIDGADHGYWKKEYELANQIVSFLN